MKIYKDSKILRTRNTHINYLVSTVHSSAPELRYQNGNCREGEREHDSAVEGEATFGAVGTFARALRAVARGAGTFVPALAGCLSAGALAWLADALTALSASTGLGFLRPAFAGVATFAAGTAGA